MNNSTTSSLTSGQLRHNLFEPGLEVQATLSRLETLLELITKVKPVPATPKAWERFHELPLATQSIVVNAWKDQSLFIQGALDAGLDATDEKGMLTYALGKLNLLCNFSLTNEVEAGDVIEIFNADYIQVYRSFSYFALCQYSLVELSAYPWYELYERASSVTKDLLTEVQKIYDGTATRVSFLHIPEYTLRELLTEDRRTYLLREKFGFRLVSPITGEYYGLSVKTVREVKNDISAGPANLRFI